MEAMFLLIAISLLFVVAIGAAFWWAIFAGQFDDSDSAARSILGEDEGPGDPAGSHAAEAGAGGGTGPRAERATHGAPEPRAGQAASAGGGAKGPAAGHEIDDRGTDGRAVRRESAAGHAGGKVE